MTAHLDYLLSRRTVASAFLTEPKPDEAQLQLILTAAARVPDHKKLEPWRFLRFDAAGCERMGKLLEARLVEKNPKANETAREVERTRFKRAPMVLAVIASPKDVPSVPEWEQVLSAGAVCMNMMHAAHASGFSAQWLTEWYAFDDVILEKLGLAKHEKIAGFIHIGTPSAEPKERPRPDLSQIVSVWGE